MSWSWEVVDISLRIDGTRAVLDFGPAALSPEDIELRIQQVVPLLSLLLEADIVQDSLEEPEFWKRFRGSAAQNMIVEGAIWSATLQAELLTHIVTGRESIASHGFPEFGDE
jgi:hypothetical protein